MKFSGVKILQGVEISIFLLIFEWALSQIQLYSMFRELPVISNTVVIITVCVKVAKSIFLVKNKRIKWAESYRGIIYTIVL